MLAESRWQDRLKILQWSDQLLTQAGIHCACSTNHVQELVVHWMIAGSLDYPFACLPTDRQKGVRIREITLTRDTADVDTRGARLIGELAVDRESISRALKDSPDALAAIMDALVRALKQENHRGECESEEGDLQLCGASRYI